MLEKVTPPPPPYLVRWSWRNVDARRAITLVTAKSQNEAIRGKWQTLEIALTPNQLRNLGTEMLRAADGLTNPRGPKKGFFARFRRS